MTARAQSLEAQVQHYQGHIEALQMRHEEQNRLLELRNNSLETQLEEQRLSREESSRQSTSLHVGEFRFWISTLADCCADTA